MERIGKETTEQEHHEIITDDDGDCNSVYDYGSDGVESIEDKNNTATNCGYVGNNINSDRFLDGERNTNNASYDELMMNNRSNRNRNRNRNRNEGYVFENVYRCYPVSYIGMMHLEKGNQIVMPPSALEYLMYRQEQVNYPMLFQIENQVSGLKTHCGVCEFTAEKGTLFLPNWILELLQLQEGDYLNIKSANLETGSFIKLQPHSMDFLSIPDPKAVLERVLSNHFFCLTTGDTILIKYHNKDFYINVVQTSPSSAISIFNTDCEVDFAAPLDYKEPEKPVKPLVAEKEKPAGFVAFQGRARRLDGQSDLSSQQKEQGTTFHGNTTKPNLKDENSKGKQFQAFTGKKYSLMDSSRY